MKRPFKSPSLFVTFASAFLGVLILGTLLQGIVVVHLVRTLTLHAPRADYLVRVIAREIEHDFEQAPDSDVRRILEAHTTSPESLVIAFADTTHHLVLASNVPPGLERRLEWMLREGRDGMPPRRRQPAPGERPFGEPPPPLGPPGPDGPPRPPDGFRPPLVLVARHDVIVGDRTVGEVLAWRHRPTGFFGSRSPVTHFFLQLPLALLLASLAGLVMFRSILGRLRALEKLAGRVAEGDLDVRVPDPGADEIGRLGNTLNRMTERLAAAKRRVDDSDRQRRRLFADISHELATPLTSIRGYAETLLNTSVPVSEGERRTYLQHVVRAAERMDLLIQDLLELTRLEAGATTLTKERIDWAALCRNTLERLQPQFQEAGLALRWEGSRDEAWIVADGRRMEQVIDNLLVNTLRYVPRGGSVLVSLALESEVGDARYHLTVTDDGPGFPAADLPHVFDRFYRGSREHETEGTGLGLAIVQEIIRRHEGRVWAENHVPRGASVHVEIPRVSAGQSV